MLRLSRLCQNIMSFSASHCKKDVVSALYKGTAMYIFSIICALNETLIGANCALVLKMTFYFTQFYNLVQAFSHAVLTF